MGTHGGQVMTVGGRIDASDLGITDAHDHLFLRSPALAGQEFDDPDRAIEEVREAQHGGLRSLVELTPIGLGRRPDLMRQVARATGLHVVGATGYHRDAHYRAGHWVLDATVEVLLARMLSDILEGMHPSDWDGPPAPLDPAHAGVIKVGASYQHISRAERRRLEAAAQASRQTGVAIVIHTEVGTCGDQVADVLGAGGVDPDRIVLAHMDRNPDSELHRELLARGLFLVYDTPGRIKYQPDSALLALIEDVVGAGYGGQVLLGLDLGRRDYFRAHGGGPGLAYLMSTFVPRLEKRLGPEAVRRILVDNAARAYALSPAT